MSPNDLLGNIFDKFLQDSQIFANREVLHPDYVPDHLPHREEQIKRTGNILAPVLRGSRGSNIFIYGQTGTGKTAVVKYVLNRLLQRGREIGVPIEVSYVNCRLAGTEYRILSRLSGSIGLNVPFTGLATAEVFDRFKMGLDSKGFLLIVVLDEIDSLVKAYGDVLLYELARINEGLKESRVSIVGVSNVLHFKEMLEPRVLSSLSEEEVIFRPYAAPELRDILLERSKVALLDNVLTDGALNLCSALAAAEHGDARRALDLLRVAAELAEREGKQGITEDEIRLAQNEIERDRVVEVLKTLPLHSKLVLFGVYLITKANVNRFITGDIYEVYRELCSVLGFDPLTQRRVSGIISELDTIGVLNSRVVSLGRYGRTKKVSLGIPRGVVRNVYSEDDWVGQLVGYAPKCLSSKA